MAISRLGKRQARNRGLWGNLNLRGLYSRKSIRMLLIALAFIAIVPPIYFHFRLRRFHQMLLRECSWLNNPPLVCAHGGDSTKAFPNTMDAYNEALRSQVDCMEIDVSRSLDGVLFALHDRNLERISESYIKNWDTNLTEVCVIPKDESMELVFFGRELQRISGNSSSKVGHLSMEEIKGLKASMQLQSKFHDLNIPLLEDALKVISSSVRQVILDAKVGPPLYEKRLANDILAIVERTKCKNCVVWAKSDTLARDVLKLSSDIEVGYIVMKDPSSGTRSNLLRMRGASVVGVYHPLVNENLMKVLRGRKKRVFAWTVDDKESMERMLYENVDGVVTGDPSLFQELTQETRTQCLVDGFSLSQ